jgi:tellurite resistance protein TerC
LLETVGTPSLWIGFIALVLVFLALDLGVFHRRDEPITITNALVWTGIWVLAALAFDGLVLWRFGATKAAEFLTGFLIEKSLSLDNLFVFVLLFSALAIPAHLQHRVLFWGILTALVLRAGMIVAGTTLLQRFHWLLFLFGGFLLLSGVKLLLSRVDRDADPEQSAVLRLVRRVLPSTTRFDGHRFLVREGGRLVATPLLVALGAVELSDVAFALDSIPAIFGVTLDPFIVFTSNIFAILGLRSLYFALAGLMRRFHLLEKGLSLVLVFIGAKMLVAPWLEVGQGTALLVVSLLLGGAVGGSLLWPARPPP